ncbi:hypothetical protein [Marinobacterium aestuariivivens]|uniref:4Fe-4S ferredoxin-type domain-containing protein n=1 Tax=Marinobacterium aestuariivivens TaxID=1698799 RepID=A0ABW2AAR0_9GAMM
MAKLGLVVDLDTCVGCHVSVDSATAYKNVNHERPMLDISLTRGEK